MPFAVIQSHLSKLTSEQLAPMLELKRELMYSVGTTKQGRNYSGILAENLSEERARKLAVSLRAVGVETELLDMKQLVPNPRAAQIRNADCVAKGFTVQDMYGRERVHPWDTILLLSVGKAIFERTTTREITSGPSAGQRLAGVGIFVATGIPTSGLVGKTRTEKVSAVQKETRWILDIYTLSDAPHYRIVANQFNYDYLGERRAMSILENFKRLAEDLARLAPRATRNGLFDAVAAGQPTDSFPTHPHIRDFDNENRWQLQWLRE